MTPGMEFLGGLLAFMSGCASIVLLLVATGVLLAAVCYGAGLVVAAPIAVASWIARKVKR